jgi:hypothetical protein
LGETNKTQIEGELLMLREERDFWVSGEGALPGAKEQEA